MGDIVYKYADLPNVSQVSYVGWHRDAHRKCMTVSQNARLLATLKSFPKFAFVTF